MESCGRWAKSVETGGSPDHHLLRRLSRPSRRVQRILFGDSRRQAQACSRQVLRQHDRGVRHRRRAQQLNQLPTRGRGRSRRRQVVAKGVRQPGVEERAGGFRRPSPLHGAGNGILADRGQRRPEDVLRAGVRPARLPANPKVEEIHKSDIAKGLRDATRHTNKGPYHKTKHAPAILARIDTAKVREAAPSCDRLFQAIESNTEQHG